jgi:hypothetical protein
MGRRWACSQEDAAWATGVVERRGDRCAKPENAMEVVEVAAAEICAAGQIMHRHDPVA